MAQRSSGIGWDPSMVTWYDIVHGVGRRRRKSKKGNPHLSSRWELVFHPIPSHIPATENIQEQEKYDGGVL